ncbi:PHD finger family protein [Citrus sinensis]|uniref:PHD finger family protein n=1 Tax=Citrus sinensis TaxID=2711 RepID=A0ACB8KQW2_CITSI|nr:PHD finger family protein [Citrus sinensis]
MMGRGADGGCGTEERPCRPAVSKIPEKIFENKNQTVSIDVFSQARKVLSERCPFDEAGEDGVLKDAYLPSGLATLLKQNDSRKRHKKSHSGADKNKKSSSKGKRPKGTSIWVETEEYFRDLALSDIDALSEVTSVSSLACQKCFLIPFRGNDNGDYVNVDVNANVSGGECVSCGNRDVNEGVVKEEVKEQKKEHEKTEDGKHYMEVDSLGGDSLIKEEKSCDISDSYVGLGWLLGCRTRALLTSERPSKKRKLLGGDAGLEKILIGCPCEGDSGLCDFCCTGYTGKGLNKLIVCSSCKVAVHQKCYGVQENLDGSWLCSWCKEKKNDMDNSVKQPCVLCPKRGGALKPVNGGSMEFAHLFCSLLMPEVYIEDTMKVEPLMNVGGIKETRMKLVCNICRVKCGACVRCSHDHYAIPLQLWDAAVIGTCRTSFHPICAREARHRLEVWGKYGCNNVELRAFCAKHSDIQDNSSTPRTGDPCSAIGSESCVSNNLHETLSMSKLHKLKFSCKNGDKIGVHTETSDANSDRSTDSEVTGFSDSRLISVPTSECTNAGKPDRSEFEDVNPSDALNFTLILKKLIDRGKVNVKDIASDIGISPDLLKTTLADGTFASDLQCKLVKWLSNHAYLGGLLKNVKLKIKSSISSKADIKNSDSDGLMVSESDVADPVAVKSVPPRRRTKSSIRILRDDKMVSSSEEIFSGNGIAADKDEVKVEQLDGEEPAIHNKVSTPDCTEKSPTDPTGSEDSLARGSPMSEGSAAKPSDCGFFESCQSEEAALPDQINLLNVDQENPICSSVDTLVPYFINAKPSSGFFWHPYIHKSLQMQSGLLSGNKVHKSDGDAEISRLEASSTASVCCNHQDNLVCKAVKTLNQEIDVARGRRWDAVLVNQYLCELREAKKQGRKERRHKEAQAVLAAATAAAAASSRISSFRKDSLEESASQENLLKLSSHNGRAAISSQVMSRAKETLSRVAVPRILSDKNSDSLQSVSDFSKEHPRSCDICRRSETILNPILICSGCKVAVHLDCYRNAKESTGPWYCELCEELLSSRSSGAPSVNFWEKPYFVAECSLCGGTTGAFRKSANGQWVHAFCAEWVFESTFRRGQVNPVAGMEAFPKGIDVCCICRHKHGICIKCNYGNCQTTFHPTCARSAGFYLNVKSTGGNFQHKAYCEKHSLEQKMKAETQKHGVEELKGIKQIRVELERLRLLCERIIKREKIKRELILCSHEILAFKRDHHAARLVHGRIPFFPPDVSSESATTSLKGHTDSFKSCSEAFQRSDDVTVDSAASVKNRIKVYVPMDADQRTDDSSMSQNLYPRKPSERMQFSGKQIPHRPHLSRSLANEEEWSSKARKSCGTLEKEIVMTSDEASIKNRKLPKGFIFVPVNCLPKEKRINEEASSVEPVEPDG